MNEENRDNRPYNQNNQRRHRPGGGGYRGGHRSSGHGGRGGRSQRPLLTSSTNAAGMGLLALVMGANLDMGLKTYLGIGTVAFCLSAIISYFAQRASKPWIEKISDSFFFIGIFLVVLVAGSLGNVWSTLGL